MRRGVFTLILATLIPSVASAIIRRHDVPDSQYIVAASDYPAVVDLFIARPGDCIATLIAPEWLITAAHCVDTLMVMNDISVGGTPYPITEIHTHEGWNQDANDITLIKVGSPVVGVAPIPIYRDNAETGSMVWFVGRGDTSTGDIGGGAADGNTRAATNTVVSSDALWLRFVFNAPTDSEVTALEGISGDGDSGGPALIQTQDGLRVAGLSSYQDNGNQTLGTYGVDEIYTRVSRYVDWIDQRVGVMGPDAGVDAGTDAGVADKGVDPSPDGGSATPDVGQPDATVSDTGPGAPDAGLPAVQDAAAPQGGVRSQGVNGGCICVSPPKTSTNLAALLLCLLVVLTTRPRLLRRDP